MQAREELDDLRASILNRLGHERQSARVDGTREA
jgi:hypothetical protein